MVRFHQRVRVARTKHLNDYTDAEMRACWYNGFDYNEMGEENKFIVQLHRVANHLYADESTYPARGLEHCIEQDCNQRESARQESIRAVLLEQDQLRSNPSSSNDMHATILASIYQMYTQGPQLKARFHGLSDQDAAWGNGDEMTSRDPSLAETRAGKDFLSQKHVTTQQQTIKPSTATTSTSHPSAMPSRVH